ncbi:MAG TPA: putative nucleotidyltransferase substrate binding domain-containing protein, partial [Dissulfurispiraceae bacterium]|nr:putative nucleotidyltransferase substrate binding domain-containing protein [Dissulfurispiraceae bacterium]
DHKDKLSLKLKGIMPLVDIVRLFAFEKGVRETSTLDRLSILRERHTIAKEYAEEIEHAFELTLLLHIQHKLDQIESGREPDDFINPNALTNLQKKTLKAVFQLISKLQDTLVNRYKPFIW